jgi:hypothetical protein
MNTKHTPGPWTYTVGQGLYERRFVIDSEPGRALAVCAGFEPRNEANARLIAAAPTQHKALTATDNPNGGEFDNQRVIRMAITALFSEGHKTLAAELEAIANDQALAISKATQP